MTHLDFQRFSPLASCWVARQCAGRCSDSIGVDVSPLSCRQQEADWLTNRAVFWALEISKPALRVTNFLQQDHAYSIKATPPNNGTPSDIMEIHNIMCTYWMSSVSTLASAQRMQFSITEILAVSYCSISSHSS